MELIQAFSLFIPMIIFGAALILIAFEVVDKALIALGGALAVIFLRFITPEEALLAVDFETIILLMSMMILVEISRDSGLFSWLNVKLVSVTKGNPLVIAIIFSLITALFSAFLDNVSTIIIVVPITIELFKGLGRDPKPIILQEILMSNMGGALTLIGDPTNIIIGGEAKLTFNDFITNLYLPVGVAILTLLIIFVIVRWQQLKPIDKNLKTLFLSTILIRKLRYEFLNIEVSKNFIIKSIAILLITLVAFAFQIQLQLPIYILALAGALALSILSVRQTKLHNILQRVEWTTLLFFAGLFIMVAAIEKTGLLEQISLLITSISNDFTIILLIVLWASAIISMMLDNIAFVTVMIPVILGIQENIPNEPNLQMLWWALALGAVMGGSGSLIGSSANIVGVDLAKKHGVNIGFIEHFKYAFPLAILALGISSAWILYRLTF